MIERITRSFAHAKGATYPVLMLLLVTLGLNILCVPRLSATYDEYWHWLYGRKILDGDPSRPGPFFDSKMPFSVWNAMPSLLLPRLEGESAAAPSPESFRDHLAGARLATIGFSLLLAVYVFLWSRELYGISGGILSLFLFAFSPNIIAHSHLVTADLYVTCMITVSVYYFWKFMNARTWKNAAFSAAALGIAQLTKYTAVCLYPVFTLIALLFLIRDVRSGGRGTSLKIIGSGIKSYLKYSAFFLLAGILIINAGFIGYRSFTMLKNYEFQSSLFRHVQSTWLRNIPVPVPYPYLKGLDMVKDLESRGTTHGNVYLLGKLHTRVHNRIEGFPGYFFYVYLFKEPLAAQILILLAAFVYFLNLGKFTFLKNEVFLIVPVLFFLIYFNFLFDTHIGIRFILVAFPFLYIWCGCLPKICNPLGRKARLGCAVLCLYLVVSVLSYFPHYISYFNELVWNRTKAYRFLADSNLDWGQSEFYLERYLKAHPDAVVNPREVTSGQIIVAANALVGVGVAPEQYRWLRDNFEPTGNIAYSYLVYDIRPESIAKIKEKMSNRDFNNPIVDQGR